MMKLTAQDKKWRAESDAHTLIEAESIKEDKARMKLAIGEAKSMAVRKEKEAKVAAKVATRVTKTKKGKK